MENFKKFLYISGNTDGKKLADYIANGSLAVNGEYYKTIVFAAETNLIYNRGQVYGLSKADAQRITDLESAVEALQTAQVKVKAGEKVISLDTDGVSLQSTLSLDYNSSTKKIQLKGIGDAVVADLDATNFIKDSMVSSATLVETAEMGVEGGVPEVPYIKIEFNTDEAGNQKDTIRFSVKKLVDIYNAANINLTSAYSAKGEYTPSNVKSGASMDEVVAELVAGIADARANAGVTAIDGMVGAITLKGDLTENGDINLAISENGEISASIVGLGTAAYTDADAYATAAQGATADSAIQSITIGSKTLTKESNEITAAEILADLDLTAYAKKNDAISANSESDNFVKATIGGTVANPTISISEQTKTLAEASETSNGLALAADVKKVIEDNEEAHAATHENHENRIKALEDDTTDADNIDALEARVKALEDDTTWEEV